MHIEKRGAKAMLYRSSWVAKGANGNTHGYSIQTFVGTLQLAAEALPADLKVIFSKEELEFLEDRIFMPARRAAEQKARAVEMREADPIWRLDDAERLTLEAATRSERAVVPLTKVIALQEALGKVRTIGGFQAQQVAVASLHALETPGGLSRQNPLGDALIAIKAARDAVAAGKYGKAPAEGVRATYPYRVWAEIIKVIDGTGSDSLMRALQSKGFAKTRGK